MLKNNHILCSPLFENLNQITFDSTATSSCTLSIDHNGLHCSELVLNCMLSPSGVSLMMIQMKTLPICGASIPLPSNAFVSSILMITILLTKQHLLKGTIRHVERLCIGSASLHILMMPVPISTMVLISRMIIMRTAMIAIYVQYAFSFFLHLQYNDKPVEMIEETSDILFPECILLTFNLIYRYTLYSPVRAKNVLSLWS